VTRNELDLSGAVNQESQAESQHFQAVLNEVAKVGENKEMKGK
jgi:hypothetical protein